MRGDHHRPSEIEIGSKLSPGLLDKNDSSASSFTNATMLARCCALIKALIPIVLSQRDLISTKEFDHSVPPEYPGL